MKTAWLVSASLAIWSIGCMVELDGERVPIDEGDTASLVRKHIVECPTPRPHATGYTEYFITSGGVERRFLVYVPSGYEASTAHPLLLNLHGSGSNPEQQMQISEMAPQADARGYIVVAPQARNGNWNVPVAPGLPDDVQFIHDVLDTVDQILCIELAQVYATGFSGGGRMVSQLGCDLADHFAAIAPVGGLCIPSACPHVRTLSVIAFHGTADTVNPYDGGGAWYWQASVPDVFDSWVEHSNCDTEAGVVWASTSTSVSHLTYECEWGQEELQLYRITDFGHQWPGSALSTGIGQQSQEISATKTMLDFFALHSLDTI
jgi:polyhydroxybutyrate depolymerase